MLITVIDLEWTTNAINWPHAPRDIIEIGACQLNDETGWIIQVAGCFVKPTTARISKHCATLTGITPAQAADGRTFPEACAWLHTKYGTTNAWASFGDNDRGRLAAQCRREGLPFPLIDNHIDIQRVATAQFGWRRRRSLVDTLKALGLQFQGRRHNAVTDAENAAKALCALRAPLATRVSALMS